MEADGKRYVHGDNVWYQAGGKIGMGWVTGIYSREDGGLAPSSVFFPILRELPL